MGYGGRPTKYKKKYCEMLIKHCEKGLSFETFAAQIDTHRDTLYEWVRKHPEFSYAKKMAIEKRNEVVEKLYIQACTGNTSKKFNPAMMIFWAKNTLKWVDRVEQEISSLPDFKLNYKID